MNKKPIPVDIRGSELAFTITQQHCVSPSLNRTNTWRNVNTLPSSVSRDNKLENSGRLAKWAIELGEHDIRYKPRSAMKGQVVADFIAESSIKMRPKISEEATTSPTQIPDKTPLWTLFIDRASSSEGSGAGLILTNSDREEITYALRFEFPASNNEAEYEALIAGLELAIKMEVRHLQVFSDSLLVTKHVKGSYKAREESTPTRKL
ncbi:rve domain-containing protein [Tanacetum coccineum]